MSDRAEIINLALQVCNGSSYLEIGCKVDKTFRLINAKHKVGVDIESGGTIRMSSDDYFAQNKETFDVIFVDGSHHHDFVMRDFLNSMNCLNDGGFILMHDNNPSKKEYESLDAYGTAWRAFVHIRSRNDVDAIVCNFDHGLACIRKSENKHKLDVKKTMDELKYEDLDKNRNHWLNSQEKLNVIKWIKSSL